ncbi:hypothetical protein HPG69_000832, partial [Diceros bicornis minor]
EEQIAPCTRTENTRCQCKRGTFHGEDSPEVCQKCSTRCDTCDTSGSQATGDATSLVPVSVLFLAAPPRPQGFPVPLGSSEPAAAPPCPSASGEAPVPGEPVTTHPWPPTASSPSSGNPWLVMGIVVGAVGVVLLLVVTAYYYRKRVLQVVPTHPQCTHLNSTERFSVSSESPHSLCSALLLFHGPAGAEGSQMRRRLLVPANGADPTESEYFVRSSGGKTDSVLPAIPIAVRAAQSRILEAGVPMLIVTGPSGP